jgi:hypothetical protein
MKVLWIDIKAQLLFDQILQPVPPQIRRLQCGDPRTVKRYNKALWTSIKEHKLDEKYTHILEDSQVRQIKQQKKWEQLDRVLLKLRMAAEKKCRKLKMGRVQWSPEFAQQKIMLKYWCLAKRIQERVNRSTKNSSDALQHQQRPRFSPRRHVSARTISGDTCQISLIVIHPAHIVSLMLDCQWWQSVHCSVILLVYSHFVVTYR